MATPPSTEDNPDPKGCLFAVAISVFTVVGGNCTIPFLTGQPLNFGDEWGVFLFQILIVTAPFGLLAGLDVRNRLPWIVGLALTFAFWGYYLFDGVRYQWYPDGSGANIGLGLIILVSPFFIAAACLGAQAWLRRHERTSL